jgi:hypothetical protein
MSKLKGGLLLLVIFVASVYVSFLFEGSYRRYVRHLYVVLSAGDISFFGFKEYIHFASARFVLSFGFFVIMLCFLGYRQTGKQRIINVVLGLMLLMTSIAMHVYFDSIVKIAECTACSDGTRKLHATDIPYDGIFIGSLVWAILPFLITEFSRIRRQKANANALGADL